MNDPTPDESDSTLFPPQATKTPPPADDAMKSSLGGADSFATVTHAAPPTSGPPSTHEMISGYEILGELGRGAMGVVYEARQVEAGRIVALKMILAGNFADEEDPSLFRTEAEAIARLQYPNIVQVFEVGDYDGNPFFSLEFCSGGSYLSGVLTIPIAAK